MLDRDGGARDSLNRLAQVEASSLHRATAPKAVLPRRGDSSQEPHTNACQAVPDFRRFTFYLRLPIDGALQERRTPRFRLIRVRART